MKIIIFHQLTRVHKAMLEETFAVLTADGWVIPKWVEAIQPID